MATCAILLISNLSLPYVFFYLNHSRPRKKYQTLSSWPLQW